MKLIFSSIVLGALFMALLGCGKSQATKEAEEKAAEQSAKDEEANRRTAEQQANAQQKFKEAVAAVLVRTKGSTYEEFRQSRLNLEAVFESNRPYLTNVNAQFIALRRTMDATENIWNRNTELLRTYSDLSLSEPGILAASGFRPDEVDDILIIVPSLKGKLNYTEEQRRNDPDFDRNNYVPWGLTKIKTQCDLVISALDELN
jgi:hypothetical protein